VNRKELKGRLQRAIPRPVTAGALQALQYVPGLQQAFDLSAGVFDGERKATFAGMSHHQQEVLQGSGHAVRTKLRRSVHRLEKGLIMRPRRPVFALDYIHDAVSMFQLVYADRHHDDDAVLLEKWAFDVLSDYFDAVEAHPTIDSARRRFTDVVRRRDADDGDLHAAPYQRDLSTPPSVSIDALLQLAHRRRSVRWFLQKPVPHDVVDQCLEVALQSPSACNRQPFEVRIYDEEPLLRKLAAIPMGTTGLHQNFPMLVLWVGQLRSFSHHRDRHVPYIDASLAAMAFQFALETQGLSSVCINWPDIPKRERMLRDAIHLDDDERVVMFMAVGYPDPTGEVPFSQKKPLDAIRTYNKP